MKTRVGQIITCPRSQSWQLTGFLVYQTNGNYFVGHICPYHNSLLSRPRRFHSVQNTSKKKKKKTTDIQCHHLFPFVSSITFIILPSLFLLMSTTFFFPQFMKAQNSRAMFNSSPHQVLLILLLRHLQKLFHSKNPSCQH